jgi:hypothetical protein
MLDWSDLLAGLAIFLVLEGIAPFIDPARMKRALAALLMVPDAQLRLAGLGSVVVGVLLLVWVRA